MLIPNISEPNILIPKFAETILLIPKNSEPNLNSKTL